MKNLALLLLFLFCCINSVAQEIELYQQFNGRYDYTAIGNTMNLEENESSSSSNCSILTSSSSSLNLLPSQTIEAAYLYWAGSGNGDFNVTLNGNTISAERTFTNTIISRTFFAAFADVTSIVSAQETTDYTLSDLDVSSILQPYCDIGVNFAGWSIIIVYQDNALPINQVNVYDGLQSVPSTVTIVLENLNILDNEGAKIGFLAWEGDSALAVDEQLSINGNVLESLPLNPANNAFNGTNSFTGQSDLYNMDIDFYNIENNINIGDTSATIELTSGLDVVLVNNIVTVLNSQLPDATIALDNYIANCGSQFVDVSFTIFNTNSTDSLPANTPIAFYIDTNLIATSSTLNSIAINSSETQTITIEIPDNIPDNFTLVAIVDDQGDGSGIVIELNETNNSSSLIIELSPIPSPLELNNLISCNQGFDLANFNLIEGISETIIANNLTNEFYESLDHLIQETSPILNPENYASISSPQTIYIKVDNDTCFDIYTLQLQVENCPPIIPQGFSPNDDGKNDWFNIQGLYNIFLNHELHIYNRYGVLIFSGDNDKKWFGNINKGFLNTGNVAPVGTYYYVLNLNDSAFQTIAGWVYLNR